MQMILYQLEFPILKVYLQQVLMKTISLINWPISKDLMKHSENSKFESKMQYIFILV